MPVPMAPEDLARHTAVLNESADVEQLVPSALALAASEDRDSLIALARALRSIAFLARLEGSAEETTDSATNLADVFIELTSHPTEFTGRLCELIYGESGFHELPARINLILRALGAVKPVTSRAAEIFRETCAGGFAQVNGPILLTNGEPLALAIFAEIITGEWVESYVKVDILHRALVPARDRLPVLQMCQRLLAGPLDEPVRSALIESLYDLRSKDWYGPAMYPPEPPDWNLAPDSALELLLAIGEGLRKEWPAVNETCVQIAEILRSRRR